jgi:propionate CoA-transferase
MEREALTLESLAIAMAVRNSGGIVIAQVERLAEAHSLNPRQVKIPGILVDCVVVAEKPEYHQQTFAEPYSAAFAGEVRVPVASVQPMAMDAARSSRAARRWNCAPTAWSTWASACPKAWRPWRPKNG